MLLPIVGSPSFKVSAVVLTAGAFCPGRKKQLPGQPPASADEDQPLDLFDFNYVESGRFLPG
jgi:hypothetical protein